MQTLKYFKYKINNWMQYLQNESIIVLKISVMQGFDFANAGTVTIESKGFD